ncbi:MAG: type II secretion system protein [Planctomycetota bacterium]
MRRRRVTAGDRAWRGFTLIELLVVISIIGLLIGILLPALGAAYQRARVVADAAKLRDLSMATQMYLNDFDLALPQYFVEGFDGEPTPVGALFGGKKGRLPLLEIDLVGAERRPLNSYVIGGGVTPDLDASGQPTPAVELPAFESPLDSGGRNLPVPGFEETDSMYDLVGSSYTLNDHAPDENPSGDDFPTLVPPHGGRLPPLVDSTKTWVLGTHTIYTFDDGGDELTNRGHDWFDGGGEIRANLAFADSHVETSLVVPPDQSPETADYTFLPRPDWIERPGF